MLAVEVQTHEVKNSQNCHRRDRGMAPAGRRRSEPIADGNCRSEERHPAETDLRRPEQTFCQEQPHARAAAEIEAPSVLPLKLLVRPGRKQAAVEGETETAGQAQPDASVRREAVLDGGIAQSRAALVVFEPEHVGVQYLQTIGQA